MDRTVPAGAAILLGFVRKTETGRAGRASYDVIYGHKQGELAKPLTSMTLDEVIAAQRLWSRHHGSSAAGGYQVLRATLLGLISELGLRGTQKYDPGLQDRLGYHLLKRRGYAAFMAGRIDSTEFGKRLAQEWASFPVLAPTKGAERFVHRGQSYYAGDGLNKALVTPEQVETVLRRALMAGTHVHVPPAAQEVVEDAARHSGKSTTIWSTAGSWVLSAVTALSALETTVAIAVIVMASLFAIWIIRERMRKSRRGKEALAAIQGIMGELQ